MRAIERGGGDAARINGKQDGWGFFGHGAFLLGGAILSR
jgi:hypothetical protein